jgi:hypothetical protein
MKKLLLTGIAALSVFSASAALGEPVKCLTPEGVEESCQARYFKDKKWPDDIIHPQLPNKQCWIETILALEAKRDATTINLKEAFKKLQSTPLSVLEAGEWAQRFVRIWVVLDRRIERLCEAPT